jgi:hypothetical protein
VQLEKPPPSSWHWNVLPPSVDVKLKLAAVEFVGFVGLAVMVVFGAVASIVHVKLAGEGSVFPAVSTALTWNVWLPAVRPEYARGLEHAAKAAPSRLHWKLLPASVEVKERLALVWFVGFVGCAVIVVFGAVVSTVQV